MSEWLGQENMSQRKMQHIIFQCVICFSSYQQAAHNVHTSVHLHLSDVNVTEQLSDDVELTHRGLFSSAALIKPLAVGCSGKDGAVLSPPSIRLQGDLSLPVFEAQTGP